MKILFINNFKEATGWSEAGRNYILALDAAGITIVPRHIDITGTVGEVPKRILELEKQSDKNCDVVIQCLLPHMMEYNGNFQKNIALIFTETSHFNNSNWGERLNCMDEIWVPSYQQVRACQDSHVITPVKKVPCPIDTSKFEREYEELPLNCDRESFKFYAIGELIPRKNIKGLIQAFHLAFESNENVDLIIKGSIPGLSPADSMRRIEDDVNKIKYEMGLYDSIYDYKSEVFVTKRLSEYEMCCLHNTCDVYVSPSYGESINLGCMDAIGFGKNPIVTDGTGMCEYLWSIRDDNTTGCAGYPITSRPEPVMGMRNFTFDNIFIANESWYSPDINNLAYLMRFAYENHKSRQEKSEFGKDLIYDYSFNNIGQYMKKLLESSVVCGGTYKQKEKGHSVNKIHNMLEMIKC